MVTVGIVDDHRAMLVGTTSIIESHAGFHVVAAGRTVAEVIAHRRPMDVVLLDLSLSDGSATAPNIAALAATGARVLVYAAQEPVAELREAAKAGAVGMIDKAEEAAHLMTTLRAAAAGQLAAGTDWTAGLVDRAPAIARVVLSAREIEVFSRYASGDTAEKVAQELFVSRETVLDHVRRIRGKYAAVGRPARTKVDLFRRAVEDGYMRADL